MHKIELLSVNSEDLYFSIILKEFLVKNVSRIKFLFSRMRRKNEEKEYIFKGFQKRSLILDTF